MRMIDGDELVMWLSQWMTSSFGTEPTEETEAIRKVCDAVGDMVKDLAKDTGGDLISRQTAIDALEEQLDYLHKLNKDENPTAESNWYGVNWARNTIDDLPPAEPKTGHWIPVDSYSAYGGDETAWMVRGNPIAFYYCSECKEQAYAGETGESLLTDYCPHCGADMRGENNE